MNLELYNKVREVPKEAQKPIGGGKLKGMTDINPMWRIKTLTEHFGMCGVGWYIDIKNQWSEINHDNNEVAVFVDIHLFVKQDGEWSKPIIGTGGSMLTAVENKTNWETKEKEKLLVTNDEAYKMALTDAISVACKALGFGANIYWNKDRTKYDFQTDQAGKKKKDNIPTTEEQKHEEEGKVEPISKIKITALEKLAKQKGITFAQLTAVAMAEFKHGYKELTEEEHYKIVRRLEKKPDAPQNLV